MIVVIVVIAVVIIGGVSAFVINKMRKSRTASLRSPDVALPPHTINSTFSIPNSEQANTEQLYESIDKDATTDTYASLSGQHAIYVQPLSLTLDGPEYEGVPNKGKNFVDYYASADIFSN